MIYAIYKMRHILKNEESVVAEMTNVINEYTHLYKK